MQSDSPTKESLAQLIIEFVQYQEKRLGKNVSNPQSTRLPMRCFMDFKPGGSLCQIFSNMYRFKTEKGLRKLDFSVTRARKDSNASTNNQLLEEIETALIEAECHQLPVVFVRSEVDDADRKKIKQIIESHRGEVTEDEDVATHLIYPGLSPVPEEYVRLAFHRGKNVMIHLYYSPESYDTWVSDNYDFPVSQVRFRSFSGSSFYYCD